MIIKTQKEWDDLDKSQSVRVEIRSKEVIIIKETGNLTVNACDSSIVYAYDSSKVNAWDSSKVNAWNSSVVYAYDSSKVNAWNSSVVYAHLTSVVYSYYKSEVKAYDNVTIYDRSDIEPQVEDTVNVIRDFIKPTFKQWLDRGVIYADGIYRNIESKKTIGDITIYETNDGYVVQKGDKFSHGETIEKAKEDLIYKLSDRDKSDYEDWDLETVKPLEEMIEAYRVITGACEFGVKDFCKSIKLKDEYSVKEVIELTEGKYGNEEFKEFFN